MVSVIDILFDPHSEPPWKFPEPGIQYTGTIVTTPYVARRLDRNGNPQCTPDGTPRWSLWTSVDTTDGTHGFCIDNNQVAKAFNGRAGERNLRRWAAEWQIGGQLHLSWTPDGHGRRIYRGRYTPPEIDSGPLAGAG
ncbi:hypothetical protein APR12_003280 [Nocardia amikacinitolerans]|nr:hypothetical protein [Nocardia amikacinitolerans]